MSKKEYGYSRTFVAVNADFIKQELDKKRTLTSIWKELMQSSDTQMPYNTFLYNVRNLITERNNVLGHQHQALRPQQTAEKPKEQNSGISTFNFSTNHDPEDELI